uniref:DUF7589 domain-containing protein n=1 Tax=Fagus sylvatica TaxID=28930 RepID=A0A2N9GR08_FAGSY
MKEVFFFRDSEGFASAISDALRPDPHSSLRPLIAQISWLNSAWLISRLDGSDLGLAWSDHGSMARITTQWLRGSDLEMVLTWDLSSVARWLGSISAHQNIYPTNGAPRVGTADLVQALVNERHVAERRLKARARLEQDQFGRLLPTFIQVIDLTEQEESEYWSVISAVFEGRQVDSVTSRPSFESITSTSMEASINKKVRLLRTMLQWEQQLRSEASLGQPKQGGKPYVNPGSVVLGEVVICMLAPWWDNEVEDW